MTIETLEHRIIDCIKPLNVERIIVFGSMAYGKPDKDSDIDILIVTSDTMIPASLDDFLKLKRQYSDALAVIRDDFPIDLILHTLPMYRKFIELGSSFSREISSKGKIIYETPMYYHTKTRMNKYGCSIRYECQMHKVYF